MRRYITLDGGTTSTKISVVSGGEIIDTVRVASGGTSGIASDVRGAYFSAVRCAIAELLARCALSEADIFRIIASGTMATSELGLYPCDHLFTPVGIEELKCGAIEVAIPEISTIPFVIVRGVKTACTELLDADMMRGEESEIMGLLTDDCEDCAFMLMGSHTKIVRVEGGRISDISTLLTGEIIAAISGDTILKHAFSVKSCTLDLDYIKKGYEYRSERSEGEAYFKVRVLKNIFGATDSEAYSFFLGIALFGEIEHIRRIGVKRVIVGGNRYLKEAVCLLLEAFTDAEVVCLTDGDVDASVPKGLVKIFEYKK